MTCSDCKIKMKYLPEIFDKWGNIVMRDPVVYKCPRCLHEIEAEPIDQYQADPNIS